MILQIVIIACLVVSMLFGRFAPAGIITGSLLLAGLLVPGVVSMTNSLVEAMRRIESERMAVGAWIREHSDPGDRLLAAHGHIAREAGLYTIDYSGLNSRIAADYRLDVEQIITHVHPEWVVLNAVMDRRLQAEQGYQLRKSFYNITGMWVLPWRVYQRSGSVDTVAVSAPQKLVRTDGRKKIINGVVKVSGARITIEVPNDITPLALTAGLERDTEPAIVTVSVYTSDQALLKEITLTLAAQDPDNPAEGYHDELAISLEPGQEVAWIVITGRKPTPELRKKTVTLVDPIFLARYAP
jgi:hypothetical protein